MEFVFVKGLLGRPIGPGRELPLGGPIGGIASIDEDEENGEEIEPLSLYLVLSVENVPTGPRPNPEPKSKPSRC